MARTTQVQTNFTAGEISPRLIGRTDFEKYFDGVETMENFITYPHGGCRRRSGTRYVAEVKTSSLSTILIGFQFSTTQAYVLEFGNLYIRFFKDGGQILSGGVPYEIVSPYATADLPNIKIVQSADTLFLVHPGYAPRTLTRTSDTSWTMSTPTFVDGPYQSLNTTATTITPSGTTGAITLTASASLFQTTHVGAFWRLQHGATVGYAVVTAYTSPTIVNATVMTTLGGVGATALWWEGAWSTYRGYPHTITFFEDRLIFGGNNNQPTTVWGSKSGSYYDMTPGVNDDDALDFTITSRQVNNIRWMIPATRLLIGTFGTEFSCHTSGDAPLSPTNVRVSTETAYGSNTVFPAQIGNTVLYIQRAGRKIREMLYNFDLNSYLSTDLTMMSEHITSGGITDLAYQQELDSIVWMVRNDGQLLGMTYERDQKVISWHHHQIGGSGAIESITTITQPGYDELWMIVRRTINGQTKRYVEYLGDYEWEGATKTQWEYLNTDSALTYSGVAITTVTGLDHLEGETVKVLANGAVHPDRTVTAGTITLAYAATEIEVGLSYTSTLKTLRQEGGSQTGTSQGKIKRYNEIVARFYETLGGKLNGDTVYYRDSSDSMDTAPPLFSGDKRAMNLGYDTEGQITIVQDQPLPMTILSIVGTVNVND